VVINSTPRNTGLHQDANHSRVSVIFPSFPVHFRRRST
jgi:hypothetical protein